MVFLDGLCLPTAPKMHCFGLSQSWNPGLWFCSLAVCDVVFDFRPSWCLLCVLSDFRPGDGGFSSQSLAVFQHTDYILPSGHKFNFGFLFKFPRLIFMCLVFCLHVFLCTKQMSCPWKPEEGVGFPGTEVHMVCGC